MQDADCLVIAEVRYRSSNRFARASLTVDRHKQQKIIRTTAYFLAKHPQFANSVLRFDVVAIDADAQTGETIEWIRDAFRPGDARL